MATIQRGAARIASDRSWTAVLGSPLAEIRAAGNREYVMPNRWFLHLLSLAAVIAIGAYVTRIDRELDHAVTELRVTNTALQSAMLALQASQRETRRHESAIQLMAVGIGRLELIEDLFEDGQGLADYQGETVAKKVGFRIANLAGYDTLGEFREARRTAP